MCVVTFYVLLFLEFDLDVGDVVVVGLGMYAKRGDLLLMLYYLVTLDRSTFFCRKKKNIKWCCCVDYKLGGLDRQTKYE